jgi:hypothetical protein
LRQITATAEQFPVSRQNDHTDTRLLVTPIGHIKQILTHLPIKSIPDLRPIQRDPGHLVFNLKQQGFVN